MRLRSLLLDSLGHAEARFHPITMAFTDDEVCTDTVMWLDNGGGKTSLSSLVFSVLDPEKNHFIAHMRDGQYKLDQYVLSGDTGHVALRWDVTVPQTLTATPLVTGQVLEWADRTVSEDGSRLHRMFYGFVPTPGLDIDSLPTRDADNKLLSLKQYSEALRQAFHDAGIVEFTILRDQRKWRSWLDDHWLDTTLLHQQVVMNGEEGGASKLFEFTTVWDFADLLLKLLSDDDALAVLTDAVIKLRDKFSQQRVDRADLELCQAVVVTLAGLAEGYDDAREAGQTATRTLAAAAKLRDALLATVTAHEALAAQADLDAGEAKEAVRRLTGEQQRYDYDRRQVRTKPPGSPSAPPRRR